MTIVMTVSGEPSSSRLRLIWLSVTAVAISSWGFIVSIFAPFLKQAPEPPVTVEAYASRYRTITPEPRKPKPKPRQRARSLSHKSLVEPEVPLPRQPLKRSASVDRRRSSIRKSGIALYEFAKNPTQRQRAAAASNKTASTRPRAASDPTDTNRRAGIGAPRIQKCVTFASAAAAKSTAPARPLIKRARTVLQRSLAFADCEDGEKGFVAVQRTFFRNACVRTRNAMDCSATFATTAFHVVLPSSKVGSNAFDSLKGRKGKKAVAPPSSEATPAHPSPCSRLRLKRFNSYSSVYSLARFHN